METKPKKTIAPRVDMPCQPADVRAHNFDEVATGYTKEMAMQEASRLTVEPLTGWRFENGKLIGRLPSLGEIEAYAAREKETFWDEYTRNVNPEIYKVDLSDGLYELKTRLIAEHTAERTGGRL